MQAGSLRVKNSILKSTYGFPIVKTKQTNISEKKIDQLKIQRRLQASNHIQLPQEPIYNIKQVEPPNKTSSSLFQDKINIKVIVKSAGRLLAVLFFFKAWLAIASLNSSLPLFASVSQALTSGHLGKSAYQGVAAGFLHTLCGADHLAALTPLTVGQSAIVASFLGALWGFGHATGQAVLGLLFAFFKEHYQSALPNITKWAGLLVALTLITIGVYGIYEAVYEKAGEVEFKDQGDGQFVVQNPQGGAVVKQGTQNGNQGGPLGLQTMKYTVAVYVTGCIHGLHPDSLFVVVPALALPGGAAVSYCAAFVLGTVFAMGGYALFIGTTCKYLSKGQQQIVTKISIIASVLALTLGCLLLLTSFGVPLPLPEFLT